jgi:hypothetical protein
VPSGGPGTPAQLFMENDDIQSELDKLWGRVTAGPESPMPAPPPLSGDVTSLTREASLEAMSMLKRQHRQEAMRLQQLVELKEQSLGQVTDRLHAAENEIAGLRRKVQGDDERMYQEIAGVSSELENAHKMVSQQEERFREEERILRSIVDATRQQLASDKTRLKELEGLWNEREQEYLLEIRELQARGEKAAEASAKFENRNRRSLDELGEAKKAIEATLGELLKERTLRQTSDKERDKSLARVKEVEEHFQELQNLWDEERAQWQELWDRERSTWETQRKEFTDWETKVRSERADWHQQLQGLEGREVKYREQMAEILRRSTGAAEKITGLMQDVGRKMKDLALGKEVLDTKIRSSGPLLWKQIGAVAVVALMLAISYPVYRHMHRLRVELAESHVLVAGNPTGMAFDGTTLWLTEWDGRISKLDPADPGTILHRVKAQGKTGPYHPIAIAAWGDSLFTLDSAQGRILKHPIGTPSKVEKMWRSPGPAPIALAHDGRNLWSFDAATKSLYRHLGEGTKSEAEAYRVDLDILPTAMAWFKDELWTYDSKGGNLRVFRVKGRSLELISTAKIPTPISGMTVLYRQDPAGKQVIELWGLTVPDTGSEAQTLQKFRVLR